jgi:hypothetical protein
MNIVYVYSDQPSKAARNLQRSKALVKAINHNSRHTASLISVREFIRSQPDAHSCCASADLIVIQGAFDTGMLPVMQRWRAAEKVLIADLDDSYHLLPENNMPPLEKEPGAVGGNGRASSPGILVQRWALQLVHAAIACSSRLADDCSPLTRVFYLPEYIELGDYEVVSACQHTGVVLGWRGSRVQAQGFLDSGLAQALQSVCATSPSVSILLGEPEPYAFQHLQIPAHQKHFFPLAQTTFAAPFWSQIDIGLAPACGPYDQRRGRMALLEYMCMRIPWLASESPAYYELRSYGRWVKNHAQDWQRAILQMVETIEDQRAFAAGSPYVYALSQGLDANIERVLAVYEEICSQVRVMA